MGSSDSKEATVATVNNTGTTDTTASLQKRLDEAEYIRLRLNILDIKNDIVKSNESYYNEKKKFNEMKMLRIEELTKIMAKEENSRQAYITLQKELALIEAKIKSAEVNFKREKENIEKNISEKLNEKHDLNTACQRIKTLFHQEETAAQKRFDEWRLIQMTNETKRKQDEQTLNNLNQQISLAKFYLEKRTTEMNRLPPTKTDQNKKNSPEQRIMKGLKPKQYVELFLKGEPDYVHRTPGLHILVCDKSSTDYAFVINKFLATTQKHFEVLEVKKIINYHSKASYMLRKKEYTIMHGRENVEEEMLFRGVRAGEVDRICKHNFDWDINYNYMEKNFSKGLSFTPVSNQANRNCDQQDNKVAVLATVLKCKNSANNSESCTKFCSHELMVDQDKNQRRRRYCIKYRSDEFYPNYLIFFRGSTIVNQNNKK